MHLRNLYQLSSSTNQTSVYKNLYTLRSKILPPTLNQSLYFSAKFLIIYAQVKTEQNVTSAIVIYQWKLQENSFPVIYDTILHVAKCEASNF